MKCKQTTNVFVSTIHSSANRLSAEQMNKIKLRTKVFGLLINRSSTTVPLQSKRLRYENGQNKVTAVEKMRRKNMR